MIKKIIIKMLLTIILLPILGSIMISLQNNNETMKFTGLFISTITFLISMVLWYQFDNNILGYQFVYDINKLSQFHINLGVDGINLVYLLLTTFITPIALLSNYKINNSYKMFVISFLMLESLQIITFVALDLVLFYVFFESVLPFLYILILNYGSAGENRIRSAFLLFLYTLFGSLFMLLSILTIYQLTGTTDFYSLSLFEFSLEGQKILWLGFFLAFAVKTPLVPFSNWLHNAHAEGSLATSILLAATVLKLATYGYLRILLAILPDACYYFQPLVQTLALISLVYASLATITQTDVKKLVAYSSIAHMAVVVLGLFSNTVHGIMGAILLSLAHGFCSPALFICVGGVLYERTGTRKILELGGYATYMPIFTIIFFIFTLANTGIPLTLNFLGEQLALAGIWSVDPYTAIIGASGIFLSACYSVFLYNKLSYGPLNFASKPVLDLDKREFYLLLTLLIPMILFGFNTNIITNTLDLAVTNIIYTN